MCDPGGTHAVGTVRDRGIHDEERHFALAERYRGAEDQGTAAVARQHSAVVGNPRQDHQIEYRDLVERGIFLQHCGKVRGIIEFRRLRHIDRKHLHRRRRGQAPGVDPMATVTSAEAPRRFKI